MRNNPTDQLVSCLKECISKYGSQDVISPENLAVCAINVLDPDHDSPPTIEWGCNLSLRRMAEKLLRREFDPTYKESNISHQIEMFAGLQDRYPAKRNGEHVYVPRMALTKDERERIIERMQKEVTEKQKHIDAFTEEHLFLIDTGYYSNQDQD